MSGKGGTGGEPIKDQLRNSRIHFRKEFERKCEEEARRRARVTLCGAAVQDFVDCANGEKGGGGEGGGGVRRDPRRRTLARNQGRRLTPVPSAHAGRTVSAAWKCRYHNQMMRDCLKLNNTEEFRARVTAEFVAKQDVAALESK